MRHSHRAEPSAQLRREDRAALLEEISHANGLRH